MENPIMDDHAQNQRLAGLLAELESHAFLSSYNLSLYRRHKNPTKQELLLCGSIIRDAASNEICQQFFHGSTKNDFATRKTTVYRYTGGFLSFVLSFEIDGKDFCLVGNGVRDNLIDLLQLEHQCKAAKLDVFALLNQLEKLPVVTVHELEEVAEQVHGILPKLQADDDYRSRFRKTVSRLSTIIGILDQLDSMDTLDEAAALTMDLLGLLFNFPGVVIMVRSEDLCRFKTAGVWGVEKATEEVSASRMMEFLTHDRIRKTVVIHKQYQDIFPGITAKKVTTFPIRSDGDLLGIIAVFDTSLEMEDSLLVEVVAGKVATKIRQLEHEEKHLQLSSLSEKFLSVTDTLLFAESKDDLHKTILELAAELLNATQGSIMLMDKDGQQLRIAYSKGIGHHLAQCMTVKVGRGIAGKVAKTGIPLLVDNIERDCRVGIKNRPRFKSKSLICVPLKLKEQVIGILNLSDKKDLTSFTESDRDMLTSFANLASIMIERALVKEESVAFAQMAITDALTGLYNRRFLKTRLEEELKRSVRHELSLTILFIDLDHFKLYNDLCGHIAGDEVLRRTAVIIRTSLRDMDIIARYGGEEFCAILPGTTKAEAMAVAERIRLEIEKEVFPEENDLPLGKLTTSIGIASFPEDGHTFTALIHSADVALYEAKAAGRNCIFAAYPTMEQKPRQVDK